MRIVWRRTARDDLLAARGYIAEHNAQAADRVFQRIRTAVRRLAQRPHLGRPGRVEGTRELIVPGTPYLVAYTILAEDVVILAVLHHAREWPSSF